MNQELEHKISDFISKYYRQESTKGLLKFLVITVGLALFILCLEYAFRFNTAVRTLLFYSFILMSLIVFGLEVLKPFGQKLGLIKRMSDEDVAKLVGNHFSDINDSLLNTIQLSKMSGTDELVLASVHQKMEIIAPVNFKEAIDKESLKKYLKFFIPVLLIITAISAIKPEVLKESSTRLVSHSKEFLPPAPFSFIVQNEDWKIEKGSSLKIQIKTEGENLPADMDIILEGKNYSCTKLKTGLFVYQFNSLKEDQKFFFKAGRYRSEDFNIEVFPSPLINEFTLEVDYPNYTSYKRKTFKNSGNLLVPEGSTITWKVLTSDCEKIIFKTNKDSYNFEKLSDEFVFSKRLKNNLNYQIDISNKHLKKTGILDYEISIIKDMPPKIDILVDSAQSNIISGYISDDYGFSELIFHVEKNGQEIKSENLKLEQAIGQSFVHYFNPEELFLNKDEEVQYFFEVKDNDAINGAKSTFSKKLSYRTLSNEELDEKIEESSQQVQGSAKDALKDLKEVQKSIDQFQKKLNEKKTLNWQDKQDLKNILDQQKNIEKQIEQMKKANDDKNQQSNERSQKEEQLLQKQEQLEKLFDEIFDEETKKLMEEIEKMMEELNKDKLEDMMKDLDLSNEMMEEELDRTLELFKQLEFDLKMEETIDDLKKLAEKQKQLSEETKNADKNAQEDLKQKQSELNEEFKKVQESLKDLEKKNDALEEKRDMPSTNEQQESIKQDQENSSESLENKKNSKASEQQQNAADQMQQMAEQMEQSMSEQEDEQQQEDMEDLRVLLDNLIELSHQQERLKDRMLKTNRNDPKYPKLKQAQASIRDESILIEDSLYALSKRVVQLQSIVNKEISEINRNLNSTLDLLSNNRTSQASINQQLIMTSYNNLALILDDVLQQMQQQMKMSSQSCDKPGNNKKPSMSKSQMQKQLNQQMKKLQEQMQKKQGMQKGKKDGQRPGGQSGMGSKEIAQMAAQQAAIRKELEKLKKELEQKKAGKDALENIDKALEDMEQQEKDLYNKNFTPEFFKRQQEILTRLLEAENAEREQEWDDKRESNEGKNEKNGNPDEFEEYKMLKKKEAEQLRTVPPNLKPYYERKVREYNKVKD